MKKIDLYFLATILLQLLSTKAWADQKIPHKLSFFNGHFFVTSAYKHVIDTVDLHISAKPGVNEGEIKGRWKTSFAIMDCVGTVELLPPNSSYLLRTPLLKAKIKCKHHQKSPGSEIIWSAYLDKVEDVENPSDFYLHVENSLTPGYPSRMHFKKYSANRK